MSKTQKSRYWSFILYPESAKKDWKEILTSTGLQIAVSPLHCHDVNDDKSLKKEHYHVLLCWNGPTSAKAAQEYCDAVGGVVLQPVASVKGMYEYHIHKNNPEKYQYKDDERTLINGFNILDYANLTTSEQLMFKKLIIEYICKEGILEYSSLLDHLLEEDLQAFDFATNHTILFDRYIASKRNQIKDIVKEANKNEVR